MTTIPVRPGELVVEYGGETVTLRYISEQTGVSRQNLWHMHNTGGVTVARVMEHQRRRRLRDLAKAHGISQRQYQHRLERGMTPVDAATTPVRVYNKREGKGA